MAVYFERGGPSWWDYVMPVVGQVLGGMINQGFEKNREIRAAKQAQETADAEAMRKRVDSDRILNLFGIDTSGAPTGVGGFDGLDVRGNPNGAIPIMAAIKHLVPDFDTTGTLNNLNPNLQRNVTDLGDRARVDVFNPGNGAISGQEFSYGTNPTKKYESDSALTGIKYAQDAATKREGMQQGGANYRTGVAANKPRAAQMFQDAEGNVHWVDPYSQTTKPMGLRGPQPKGAPKETITPKDIADLKKANRNSYGEVIDPALEQQLDAVIAGMVGGGSAPAIAQGNRLPPQPTEVPMAPNIEAQVGRMMQQTGKSREEVVAYLRTKGVL